MFEETHIDSFVGKTVGEFLSEADEQFEDMYPIFEEHWILGCQLDYTAGHNKLVTLLFELPAKAPMRESIDWKIGELMDEVIKEINITDMGPEE